MPFTRPKASQIDFDVTNITDPLVRLNSGESGSADKDVGIVIERGSDTNAAIIYDESADEFVVINTTEDGTTSGNVTISSYADLRVAQIKASSGTMTGALAMGTNKITGMGDPTANQDAATKAYVDTQVSAVPTGDITSVVAGDGLTGGATSGDATLNVVGGTGITANADDIEVDTSVVTTLTGSQTLTNKTLTTPVISSISNTGTLTLPTSTDTLVGRATTDTLTNKTLTSAVLNTGVSGTAVLDEDDMSSNSATQLATQQSIKAYVDTQLTAEDLDITSDSGTIAIDLDSETLTIAGGTGIDSSATSNTVTLAIDSTVATLTGTQTLENKTLRAPIFEGGSNAPEFIEQRFVNATQQNFVQLYTGASSGSYYSQGEYQKIATITPDGDSQNYTFIIRMTATSASSYQIVTFSGALRSNTLPDLSFTTNYYEEHNGTRFIEPKLWTKETTTAGFILVFEYIHSSSLFGGVNVEATIIPRSDAQRANVSFNTTQNSEISSIDTGFTENDPTLIYANVSGTLEFGTQFRIEGSSADGNELTITATNPTADRTATFPDATGTVSLVANTETLSNKTISGSSNTLSNIGNSSLTNSSITVARQGGNSTAISLGGTITFNNVANETTVAESSGTVTIGLADDVTIPNLTVSQDATITGNLTINGTTTTLSTTNTIVQDSLIELNNGASSNSNDLGFIFERGSTGDNAAIIWDESADAFVLGTTTATGASTGNLTVTAGALSIGSLTLGGTAVTSTATELNYLDGVTGITLGSANELLVVGTDGSSIASDSTLAVDTSNNRLGINQTSPEVTLHMTGEGAQTAQIRMEQHNDTSDAPDIRTRKSRGTAASSTKNAAGDFIFRGNFERYNGSSYTTVGQLAVDTNSSNADRFQLTLAASTDGNSIDAAQAQFKIDGNDSGAITFNNAYKFPTADGSANQVLQTDGSGALTFADQSGGLSEISEDTTPQLGGNLDTNSNNILIDDAHYIADENGNEQIVFSTTASAVNSFQVTNAATGNAVDLAAVGGDTNIDINLTPKGSGEINIAAGNLNYAGTAVTATGAELNKLDGVTATATELNYVDVTTLGTVEASKAVTADSSGHVAFLDSGQIRFGTGGDLYITHTGSASQFVNQTVGDIQITNGANDRDVDIRSDDGSNGTALYFKADGSTGEALLYHYGTEKFKTTSTGVTVTDDVSAETFTSTVATGTAPFTVSSTTKVTNLNADKLDGINSGAFLRSNQDDTATGNITFNDDVKAKFGTDGDLEIYHDGSNSFISDTGTGDLVIEATHLRLRSATAETYFLGTANGSVELYHDNSKKFETTSGGATVTGALTTTGDIELGHASDTTLARSSAGVVTIEGVEITTNTASQTLTNKTLTTPVISSISNTGTLTLPTSTDTLVGRATTDTLTNKTLTSPNMTSPSIGGTALTATATELNIMDGGTSATSTTLADADRVVVNDAGTMKQVALTDFETYFESALDTLSNVTSVGTLNGLTIASSQTINMGSNRVTSVADPVGNQDAATKAYVDANAGSGGGSSGFTSSTFTTAPGSDGDFDLSFNVDQDTQETPFEVGGQDAFGVNLGEVYDQMEPVGSTSSVDLGVLS